MLDKERILAKIDELDGYLKEIEEVKPKDFEEYEGSIEKKRSCERLLQISIECVVDVCALLARGLSVGLPADEDDLFDKLGMEKILSEEMVGKLKQMKGFRNIIVHRYGTVDDRLVYNALTEDVRDFIAFREQVTTYLNKTK